MVRKEEILARTSNGLDVFRHYLPVKWRVGRNFLNPLYEDSKASCNVYYDCRSGTYRMKDFGNGDFSGDEKALRHITGDGAAWVVRSCKVLNSEKVRTVYGRV